MKMELLFIIPLQLYPVGGITDHFLTTKEKQCPSEKDLRHLSLYLNILAPSLDHASYISVQEFCVNFIPCGHKRSVYCPTCT